VFAVVLDLGFRQRIQIGDDLRPVGLRAELGADLELYAQRRDQVKTALQSIPGVTLPVPQGAFYAFPKFDFVTDSAAFTAELVRKTGVALAPGVGFGRDGEGYVRVCFASTEATVREALARLRSFAIDHCSR